MVQKPIGNYTFEDIYNLPFPLNNKEALFFLGKKYTFKELNDSVNYFANLLKEKGVKPGDHVALLSVNSFNWVVAFYGIIKAGAIAVLLNYMSRHNALKDAITFTDCKYFVYGKYVAHVKDENELSTLLKETNIPEENAISIKDKDLDFKNILLENSDIPHFNSPYSKEEDSKRTAYIIFTTGTTSRPKACMLSQYSLMNIIYHNFYRLDPIFPKRFMCLLPAFHCFGLLVINAYMAYQRTVYLNELSDPKQIYKDFVKNKCGDYASVAIIFDKLARAPIWWIHRGRFVKHCIVGGGFTSAQEFSFLEKKYGKNKFLNGYGQTECSPLISLVYPGSPRDKQTSTVGLPMEDIEIAIMNPETKKIIPSSEEGEILVRGYNVFNGYYKLPKEQQPFDEQGYVHTGDLGYLDKDGYLVLSGRIKDIIVRKGENISPKEIEAEFAKFSDFNRVRVLGLPSIDDGEFIVACVELKKKPPHFVEEKYFAELHKTLPAIKIPTHIIYMKKFPLNANGKLDEVKLRELCVKKIGLFLDKNLAKKTASLMKKWGC